VLMVMMLAAAPVASCWASVEGGAKVQGRLSVMGVTARQEVVAAVVGWTWLPWLIGLQQVAEGCIQV
jgi:hypothetical protein